MLQARNNSDTAPLVLWLTGGPGCSSELAVFVENGPYMLNDKGEVEERKYAWDVEVRRGVGCGVVELWSGTWSWGVVELWSGTWRWDVVELWYVAMLRLTPHGLPDMSATCSASSLQANMIFVDSPLGVGFSYTKVLPAQLSAAVCDTLCISGI